MQKLMVLGMRSGEVSPVDFFVNRGACKMGRSWYNRCGCGSGERAAVRTRSTSCKAARLEGRCEKGPKAPRLPRHRPRADAWRALTAVLPWRAVDKASIPAFRIRRVFVELASCAGPHDRTAEAMWSAQTQERIDTRHEIRRTNAEAAWRRFCKGPKQDREGPSEAPRLNQRNLIDAASAFLL